MPPPTSLSTGVWTWGANRMGQLGTGDIDERSVPVHIPIADEDAGAIRAVAAGDEHTLALAAGGTVWTWGRNEFGHHIEHIIHRYCYARRHATRSTTVSATMPSALI